MTADKTEKLQVLLGHSSNAPSLIKAITDLVGDVSITPLEGGITNRNYRLDADGEVFVLRLGSKGAELLGIDRRREHAATAIAASLGVGAELIYSDASEDLMLTRFIFGEILTPERAAQPDMLQKIVNSIRRYHEGPDFSGTFSAFEVVRNYHHQATALGVSFPPEMPQAMELMDRIEQSLGPVKQPRPCHNDLLAANFIDDGNCMRIIDWEYAAMGDLFFDLGNFAANQELSEESCRQLLQFYFGEARSEDLAHLYLMRLASDMRESFWGFLQSGLSTLDFNFREYALKHFERFLQKWEENHKEHKEDI